MINKLITIFYSFLILLIASIFGLNELPTEMALIIVAGSIFLAFLHIDKIQKFKGGGFEAEMKEVVKEANATIHQLREVATTVSDAILTTLMSDNFFDGTTLETRMKLHDQIIKNLKDIGASEEQISNADSRWRNGVGIIFHRGIRKCLSNEFKSNNELAVKYNDLIDFEHWKAPLPSELKQFFQINNLINNDVNVLIEDYQYFIDTGNYRRPDIFKSL